MKIDNFIKDARHRHSFAWLRKQGHSNEFKSLNAYFESKTPDSTQKLAIAIFESSYHKCQSEEERQAFVDKIDKFPKFRAYTKVRPRSKVSQYKTICQMYDTLYDLQKKKSLFALKQELVSEAHIRVSGSKFLRLYFIQDLSLELKVQV